MAPGRKKGANRNKESNLFSLGDLVLAKVKGFPAWPAKISRPEDWERAPDPKKYFVQFFGTSEIAFVAPADVQVFTDEAKCKLAARCQGKTVRDFSRAVKEICEAFEELQRKKSVDSGECSGHLRSVASTSAARGNHLEPHVGFNELKSIKMLETIKCRSDDTKWVKVDDFHGSSPGSVTKNTLSHKMVIDSLQPSFIKERRTPRSLRNAVDDQRIVKSPFSLFASKNLSSDTLLAFSGKHELNLSPRISGEDTHPKVLASTCSGEGLVDAERVAQAVLVNQDDPHLLDVGIINREPPSSLSPRLINYECSLPLPISSHVKSSGSNQKLILSINRKITKRKSTKDIERNMLTTDGYDERVKDDVISTTMQRKIASCDSARETSPSVSRSDTEVNSRIKETSLIFLKDKKLNVASNVNSVVVRRRKKAVIDSSEEEGNKETIKLASGKACEAKRVKHLIGENGDVIERSTMIKLGSKVAHFPLLSGGKVLEKKKIASAGFLNGTVRDEAILPLTKRRRKVLEAMSDAVGVEGETYKTIPDQHNNCKFGSELAGSPIAQIHSRQYISSEDDADGRHRTPVLISSASIIKCVESCATDSVQPASPMLYEKFQVDGTKEKLNLQNDKHYKKNKTTDKVLDEFAPFNLRYTDKLHEKEALESDHGVGNLESQRSSLKEVKPVHFSSSKAHRPQVRTSNGDATKKLMLSGSSKSSGAVSENMNCSTQTARSRLLLPEKFKCSTNTFGKSVVAACEHNMEKDNFTENRPEAIKDASSVSSVGSLITDSNMSMKDLIAAAQAKRREAQSLSISCHDIDVHDAFIVSPSNGQGSSPISGSAAIIKHSLDNMLPENFGKKVYPPYDMSFSASPLSHSWSLVSKNHISGEEGYAARVSSGGCQSQRGSLSGGTEAAVARDAFEGMIETLSRTKESIGRATRLAIDCAKYGIANEVVELLIRKLENEPNYHRRIDLFFLVDSITQCSHNQKGIAGASYIPTVQAALPRLLGAAAPPVSNAYENRRQCHKVLRLWLERKILPESFIRRYIDEFGIAYEETSAGCFLKRPSRAERSVDDPIREMEGMLVDEYGSNATFQLPGLMSCHMFEEEEDEEEDGDADLKRNLCIKGADDNEPSATAPFALSEIVESCPGIVPSNRYRHILEEVDGELEMEDISSSSCKDERAILHGASSLTGTEFFKVIVDNRNFDAVSEAGHTESFTLPPLSSPPLPSSSPSPPPPPPPFSPSSPPPPPPLSPPSPPPPPPPPLLPPPLPPGAPPPLPIVPSQSGYHPPISEYVRGNINLPVTEITLRGHGGSLSNSSTTFLAAGLGHSTAQDTSSSFSSSRLFEPAGNANNVYMPPTQLSTTQYHQSQQQFQQAGVPGRTFHASLPSAQTSNFPPPPPPQPSSHSYSYTKPFTLQPRRTQVPQHNFQSLPSNTHMNGCRLVADENWRDKPESNQINAAWLTAGRACSATPIAQEGLFRPPMERVPSTFGFHHPLHTSYASGASISDQEAYTAVSMAVWAAKNAWCDGLQAYRHKTLEIGEVV